MVRAIEKYRLPSGISDICGQITPGVNKEEWTTHLGQARQIFKVVDQAAVAVAIITEVANVHDDKGVRHSETNLVFG